MRSMTPTLFSQSCRRCRPKNYVGAPVIAYGVVVATIHADAFFSGRPVDEVDRDVIASFATSLGQIVERAILIEQLRFQKQACGAAGPVGERRLGRPER